MQSMSQNLTSFSGLFPRSNDTSTHHNLSHHQSGHQSGPHGHYAHKHLQPPLSSQYEEDNVLMDPDWSMDSSNNSNDGSTHPDTYHQSRGSFAALAGMSPCLGVPPVDCLFYPNSPMMASNNSGGRRRRRFSLEEYQEHLDDSSSSSDSFNLYNNNNSQQQQLQDLISNEQNVMNKGSEFLPLCDDLNQAKSFMNDLSYTSDLNHLEMGSDAISHSLRAEFESLLVDQIQNGNPDISVIFPPDLLSVIARHVLQEASEEPYGMKGCLLHIQYEGQTALHHLGTLNCDPEVVAKTFELTLTLRQAQSTWGQRMARKFSFSNSSSALSVSTSYKLVKKRKYRV